MALMPKRVKYRKSQRGRIRGNATAGNYVAFGDYGIQAMQPGWLTAQQLEAARVVLSRFIGTDGRYWCRVFPQKSITAIAAETRMGKGKGEIEYWAAVIKPGTVLFEVAGIPETAAREAFRLQSGKMPFRMRFTSAARNSKLIVMNDERGMMNEKRGAGSGERGPGNDER